MSHNNRWFIGLKLLSVFSIGIIGSTMLYLPTFYRNVLNLGTDKIGFIYAITPFVSCLSFPFWTSYLDRTQAYKRIMIVNTAISMLSVLFIATVPLWTNETRMTLILVFLGNFGFSWFGYPVIAAMVDSVTFLVLGDYKELYGQQKTGCPIGYGLSVFLTGLTMDWIGPYALFAVHTLFAVAFIITIALLDFTPCKKQQSMTPSGTSSPTIDSSNSSYGSVDVDTVAIEDEDDNEGNADNQQKQQQPPSTATIWSLLATPDSCLFFLVMALMGFSTAVIQAFLFLFMRNDLHASPAMVGLLGPLGSSTEIICFFFSKQIFSNLGPKRMLMVAQWIIITRCLIYILAMGFESQGAWMATIAQLLHGAGFSLTWSAAALQSERIAPPHLKNSAQGLLNAVFNGVGAGFGAVIGGYFYNTMGAKTMWWIVITLMLVSFVVFTCFDWLKRTSRFAYTRLS